MLRSTQRRHPTGFTLIESLIGMVIMTILLVALFTIITTNLAHLFQSKARSIALQVAQEKLENLKNMPYDALATKAGTIYPPGNIDDNETLTRNNLRFKIHTDIRYVDNPYDGLSSGGSSIDLYPYDYKKATIQIYTANGAQKLAEISTDIAAKAAETTGNTGVLIIRVINAAGNPVEGATVQVINLNPNPDVSIQTQTDVQGQVIIPKMPPDNSNGYHVVISKGGYSSEQTYPASQTNPSPTNPDFGLIAQQTTIKTFTIDSLANLSLTIKDQNGNPITNRSLTVRGTKTIFSTPLTYKYSQNITTDGSGVAQLNLIEWDSYDLAISGYTILSSSPLRPIAVAPNSFTNATLYVATSPTSYPIISSVSPDTTPTGSTIIDIVGSNLQAGSSFYLKQSGQSNRIATGITYTTPGTLSGTIDLSGATGNWDLVVTTGGRSTTQEKAVEISP